MNNAVQRGRGVKLAAWIFSGLMAFAAFFPFFWMFLSSFKTRQEIFAVPLVIWPKNFSFVNYSRVLNDSMYPFLNAMGVTFFISVTAVVLALALNMMAAYAFARLEFRFKRLLWVVCISTMYIPGIAILITSYLVVARIGLLDTLFVLILPGLVSGYSIFFYRQFFLNIPVSLEEAALIDGCSRFRIFRSIFVPMSTAPMVVMGAGVFLGYWNSFIWPAMTISDPKLMQVMQVIRTFDSYYSQDYGSVLAAASMAVVPPIVMFALFQKRIVAGFVLSGLK